MEMVTWNPIRWKSLSLGVVFLAAASVQPLQVHARTWPSAFGEGSISRWSGDRVAAYTLTIDDNHPQDHAYWQALGDQYGFNWTWFVITGNVVSWADWQHLADQGHGIGSHGVTYFSGITTPEEVDAEYADSQQALRDHLTGVDALTMAYPNGYQPPNNSTLAAQYYIAVRGVVGGINQIGSINYTNTHSISMNPTTVYGVTDSGSWMYYGQLLNSGHPSYGGWYSVHFHSVLETMKAGITNMLDTFKANEADIWVGTFQQVAQYGQARENATLNITSVSGSEIRFTVTDTLDDTVFYYPLTVKIRVDSSWTDASAVQSGQPVSVDLVESGGNTYALVDAEPDAGEVILRKAEAEGLLVVVRGPSKNRVWVDGAYSEPVSSGSYEAPYRTVQEGLNAATPGDIVTVREGTYHEQVTLPSGTAELPITLSAAAGERVVLNAMVPLPDWQPMTAGLYSRVTAWEPAALYSGFRKMELARDPNEGWWQADSISEDVPAGSFTLTDAGNLAGFSHDLANASVYIWTQSDNRFYTCPVVSVDPVSGSVEFEKVNPSMAPAAGDKYWLQNQVSLIDRPNEWASEPELTAFRIYCLPADTGDLAGMQAPPASGWVVSGQDTEYVRLEDLEVAGGTAGGIYLLNAQHVEVSRCIVHNNVWYGIRMNAAQNCPVRNSILFNNRFGFACEQSSGILVEENEVGPNSEDGLVLSWGSSSLTVRRNYIHDHMLWGHPDNAQTYGGVSSLEYADNLILSGGQSVMMQETSDVEFSGNMVIGSSANMLNFGHSTVTGAVVRGNTLAFSGYSCMGLTGETSYDVMNNVFMTGRDFPMYVVTDAMDYQGDYNLFWNGAGLVDPVILVSDGDWSTASGPSEPFSIVYENNDVAAGDSSTAPDSVHTNVGAGDLLIPVTFPASNWPNVLTALQNNAGINSLAAALSAGDYFSFTITPDAEAVVSYSNLFVRVSLGANNPPAETTFTLMSSLSGFTAGSELATFTSSTAGTSSMGIQNNLALDSIAELQNVAAGTAVEFRLYAYNSGANSMTRIGIGHGFWTGAADDDLRLEGSVSLAGTAPTNGTSETIYHTSLAGFQSSTGQELHSTNSDPLFVNAPLGINVMDSSLLHQASRDTFALRDTNRFAVGDHVEINFDGVVRSITASSGAVVSIAPPLAEKPLKGWLIANWGANTDFSLDLGLQPASPGVGMGQDADTIGSTISVTPFKNGDFDGDGRRDIPQIPADLME